MLHGCLVRVNNKVTPFILQWVIIESKDSHLVDSSISSVNDASVGGIPLKSPGRQVVKPLDMLVITLCHE